MPDSPICPRSAPPGCPSAPQTGASAGNSSIARAGGRKCLVIRRTGEDLPERECLGSPCALLARDDFSCVGKTNLLDREYTLGNSSLADAPVFSPSFAYPTPWQARRGIDAVVLPQLRFQPDAGSSINAKQSSTNSRPSPKRKGCAIPSPHDAPAHFPQKEFPGSRPMPTSRRSAPTPPPCLFQSDSAFNELHLLANCPHFTRAIKFDPLLVDSPA